MVGGLVGCAGAHLLDTTIPYAVYGIATSTVCLLVTHAVTGRSPVTETVKIHS